MGRLKAIFYMVVLGFFVNHSPLISQVKVDTIDVASSSNENTSFTVFPAETRTIDPATSFVRFPPRDLYKHVLVKLYADSVFQEHYQTMANYFGHPRINFATINVTSPTEYILTLPIVKDKKVTSFIFYFATGNHYHFSFAPVSLGFELLNHSVRKKIDPVHLLTLAKYNSWRYIRLSSYYPSINSWLRDFLDYSHETPTANKNRIRLQVEIITIKGIDDGVDTNLKKYDFFIECPEISGNTGKIISAYPCGQFPPIGGFQ